MDRIHNGQRQIPLPIPDESRRRDLQIKTGRVPSGALRAAFKPPSEQRRQVDIDASVVPANAAVIVLDAYGAIRCELQEPLEGVISSTRDLIDDVQVAGRQRQPAPMDDRSPKMPIAIMLGCKFCTFGCR